MSTPDATGRAERSVAHVHTLSLRPALVLLAALAAGSSSLEASPGARAASGPRRPSRDRRPTPPSPLHRREPAPAPPAPPAPRPAESAAQPLLRIDAAEAQALANSPDLAIAARGVEAARGRVLQARAPWWPSLQWTSVYSHSSSESATQVVPNTTGAFAGTTATVVTVADSSSTQLSLRQTLFDFQRRRSNLTAVEETLLSTLKDYERVRLDTLLSLRASYFATISAQETLSIRRTALAAREQHLQQAEGLYKAGVRARIEVTKALSDLASARLDLVRAANTYETSSVALNVAMGKPSDTRFTLEAPPVDASTTLPQSSDALLACAWERRPEILALRAQARAAAAQLQGLYASRLPSVSSSATLGMQGRPSPLRESWTVGLTLDWNLFDGFATRGQIAETQANLGSLKAQADKARLQVYNEVVTGRLNLEESRERIIAARAAADAAHQSFELARQRYAVGLGSNLEFIDAQVAYVLAETNRITAENDYRTNRARLARAAGVADLSQVPALAPAHAADKPGEGAPKR